MLKKDNWSDFQPLHRIITNKVKKKIIQSKTSSECCEIINRRIDARHRVMALNEEGSIIGILIAGYTHSHKLNNGS